MSETLKFYAWRIFATVVMAMFVLSAIANANFCKAEEDEPPTHPTTTERIEKKAEKAEPVFNVKEADKQVVKITHLNGTFRGTGFYVSKDTVVTNRHVTVHKSAIRTMFGIIHSLPEQFEHLLVWNKGGVVALAKVTYRDEKHDFAILNLINNDLGLEPVVFSDKEPERGDNVFTVGHPASFVWSLGKGYISHGIQILTESENEVRFLVDIIGTGGASGSPIYNERGEVIGMVTEVFTSGSGILVLPNAAFVEKLPK